jgi:hypothetical protein
MTQYCYRLWSVWFSATLSTIAAVITQDLLELGRGKTHTCLRRAAAVVARADTDIADFNS